MIKLHDTTRQPKEVEKAVRGVLNSGRFVKGKLAEEFGERWADICGKRYGIAVSSGATALELTVRRVFGRGVVSYPSWTFVAVQNAIKRAFCTPKVDNKHPDIFAHHHHEIDIDYTPKIEDCSHCHGYKPKAETAIFSLFPAKIFGAIGDAGIIVCDSKDDADWYRDQRSHGVGGTNARMDEIQAAVLLAKLPYLNETIKKRKANVNEYNKALGKETKGEYNYVYCLDVNPEHFEDRGIETNCYYTEKEWAIPIHEHLTQEERTKIICALLEL